MQKEKFEIVSFYKFCPILPVEGYRISFKKYLIDNGDPYSLSIYDLSGNFSLKLGVTGAPETFLVIDGVIVSHRIGEVNMEVWNEKFAQYF